MTEPPESHEPSVQRVTLNLFRGCLIATLQTDLTPALLNRFQQDLLGRLADARATRVVFDCSGVEIMDPEEFEGLRRVVAMARLLGARVVLVGLRAGVVAALIAMGVEGSGLLTALSLDDALDVYEQADRGSPMADEPQGEEHVTAVGDEAELTRALLLCGRLADGAGFDAVRRAGVMTAVSELARNILKYAGRGRVRARVVRGPRGAGVEVVAEDDGPGIPDLAKAMTDHFSTGGTLGLGLPGVRRLMDDFDLWSEPGKGTRVTVRKWKS